MLKLPKNALSIKIRIKNKFFMNKNVRKVLDWIQLPQAIYACIRQKDKEGTIKDVLDNFPDWRKNTIVTKIVRWFLTRKI